MNWWQRLKKNPLAKLGALLLLVFYVTVIAAEFVAPYDPYNQQKDGALLPPTTIYTRDQSNQFVGPHVYPTTLGPVDLQTGDRVLGIDVTQPSPLRLFVAGDSYRILQIKVPLPTQFSLTEPKFQEVELTPGIAGNWHLFGTAGAARFNLLGTDDQARDQFSRLVYGGRISLSIGLVGIAIAFPIGMLVGGLSGYLGGWVDSVLMRLVEVLMTIPSIYLLVALAAVLARRLLREGAVVPA